MSVRRSRDRRTTSLEALQAKLNKVTGDGRCVALILPLVGLAMRCTRPCGRCRELAAEFERLRPEWDAERARYLAAHPNTAPKPTVMSDADPDELKDV